MVLGMRSGTPSLREAKPDPMPAADRDGQPYLMAGGQGVDGRIECWIEYWIEYRVLSTEYRGGQENEFGLLVG